MDVPINFFAIGLSVIVAMGLGTLWYGPLFGKQWRMLAGIPMDATPNKNAMLRSMGIMAVGSFLMAYVLAHSIAFANAYMQIGGISAGIQGAIWSWLGFIAPVTIGVVIWEMKPWKLWFITGGYYLVSLILMGIILTW